MLSTKDIADLEKRHSIYTLKKIFKSFLLIFSIVTAVSAIFYLYFFYHKPNSTQDKPLKTKKEINTTIVAEKKDINISSKKIVVKAKKAHEEPKASLVPVSKIKNDIETNNSNEMTNDIELENSIETEKSSIIKTSKSSKDSLIFPIVPPNSSSANHPKRKKLNFICSGLAKTTKDFAKKMPTISTNNDKNATITRVKTKRPKIDIRMKDIDSVKYLNDKFKKTHDIVFALMLCENYYKQKQYQDSLKWSVIANDIDSSSERSWIWFAKSKYRLHHKNDAIKALRSFLKTSSSQKIKSLLRDIVNGELDD